MECVKFESVELYHIIKVLNHQADNLANKETLLECGKIGLKIGEVFFLSLKFYTNNIYDDPFVGFLYSLQ
jgi:hypothetical protein